MTQEIFKHHRVTVCENQGGIPFIRFNDAAIIVPITSDNEILLITEPSPAYDDEHMLVLPGGGIEPGEAPIDAANRELQEEIGFKAGRLDLLGELYPLIKYLQARWYVYLGRDLVSSQLVGDEIWPIGIERIPLVDFESLITDGRLCDSGVIASLYLARKFLLTEREPT